MPRVFWVSLPGALLVVGCAIWAGIYFTLNGAR